MRKILAGVETEYGLYIKGRGAADQVEDSEALVRSYPGERLSLWDYGHESPRNDLRGFRLDRLAEDPVDQEFDQGRTHAPAYVLRADQILPNGARFYNDHGHPEYSTPESWTLADLAALDLAGHQVVLEAARAYASEVGREVRVYKNNTDFHGASYGTHESYLVPREIGFERLFAAVAPMLVVRQILTGAGKVGSEAGAKCAFQISQRADFLNEPANAETLYRRPVFNTRDEPHADPTRWIRLHMISCDANMMASCTARRVGLVKLALALEEAGEAPRWRIADVPAAFKSVSRDMDYRFEIALEGRSWTTAYEILESYFSAAEARLDLDEEMTALIADCRRLLDLLPRDFPAFSRHVDWAAKKRMLEGFLAELGVAWGDDSLRAYDLEYHNVDPEEGLFFALEQLGEVEPNPSARFAAPRGTRGWARGLAALRFGTSLKAAGWRSLVFQREDGVRELELPPDALYPDALEDATDVGTFIRILEDLQ